jgi:hypothetical protein
MAAPRPGITSRLLNRIHNGEPVLATRTEVAEANADSGVQVIVLGTSWRDQILNPAERHELLTAIPVSFTEVLAGYRVKRILNETVSKPETELVRRSIVYRQVSVFPELGSIMHVMDADSVKAVPGSLGNTIFSYREPKLRLRESDQRLLLAAIAGGTDADLVDQLRVSRAAIKARWRSTFARIMETMPDLVQGSAESNRRGLQKRHLVLAYVRSHPEELRPYDWKRRSGQKSL